MWGFDCKDWECDVMAPHCPITPGRAVENIQGSNDYSLEPACIRWHPLPSAISRARIRPKHYNELYLNMLQSHSQALKFPPVKNC